MAQAQKMDVGVIDVYGGMSLIYPKTTNFVFGADYKVKTPMFFLGVDYGLSEKFSVGIQFSKSSYNAEQPGAGQITYTDLDITGFYLVTKYFVPLDLKGLQPYVSLQPQLVVYQYHTYYTVTGGQSSDVTPGSSAKIYLALYAGARYNLNDRFSAFGEIGINGWSLLNLGASYRLKK
jgi:opacity protein-like surface antigen